MGGAVPAPSPFFTAVEAVLSPVPPAAGTHVPASGKYRTHLTSERAVDEPLTVESFLLLVADVCDSAEPELADRLLELMCDVPSPGDQRWTA